jgi:hypothetical protein
MQLIDWLHFAAAILFFIAALHKLYNKQGEHFFTRFLIAAWFFLTVVKHDMPVNFVRQMSNYVLMILPLIEITSPAFLRYFRGKTNDG